MPKNRQGLCRQARTDARILTLFLTRDINTFKRENYEKVKNQVSVIQDIYVVSASPIPVENNIVVPLPQRFPLPIRVAVSINKALRKIDIEKYTHIFKVDSDVSLPPDYLINLLSTGKPVAGRGAALLISTTFFHRFLGGKYPVSYCDDGYISAVSIAHGWWPSYSGKFRPVLCNPFRATYQPLREFAYGCEYYKWGLPFPLFVLLILFILTTGQKDLASLVHNLAGYLSSAIRGEQKYVWWRSYAYYRVKHLVDKALLRQRRQTHQRTSE